MAVGDASGYSVSAAGDVNQDGFDDVLIGAPMAAPAEQTGAGSTYVVFGGPSVGHMGALELSSLNGTNGFVINGVDIYESSGLSVSAAGDVNHDGVGDILVGAYAAAPGLAQRTAAGKTYAVFGGPSVGHMGALELSNLYGPNGFVINGVDKYDQSGYSVSAGGDVNHDGIDDLLIGANRAAPEGRSEAGSAYVVFGRAAPTSSATAGTTTQSTTLPPTRTDSVP